MTRQRITQLAWAAAAILLVLGSGKAFKTATAMGPQATRLEKKMRQIGTLQEIRDAMRPLHAAREAFVLLPNKEPIRLETLVRTVFPGNTATLSPVEVAGDRETAPGWRIRQVRVDLGEHPLPIATIMKFVYLAEKGGTGDDGKRAAPPWRLVNCHIWSSPHQPGYANGVLDFEALEADTKL